MNKLTPWRDVVTQRMVVIVSACLCWHELQDRAPKMSRKDLVLGNEKAWCKILCWRANNKNNNNDDKLFCDHGDRDSV